MPRSYRHISEYEREILEMRAQGKSRKEICEKFNFSLKQLKDFITRYNRNQKKLAAGIVIIYSMDYGFVKLFFLNRRRIGTVLFTMFQTTDAPPYNLLFSSC